MRLAPKSLDKRYAAGEWTGDAPLSGANPLTEDAKADPGLFARELVAELKKQQRG